MRMGAISFFRKIAKSLVNFAASPPKKRTTYQKNLDNFWCPTSLDAVYQMGACLKLRPRRSSLKYEVNENADSALFKFQSKMAAFLSVWGRGHNDIFCLSSDDECPYRTASLYDKVYVDPSPIGVMYFGFCRWR